MTSLARFIATRVAFYRKQIGISQADLADRCSDLGWYPTTVAKIEQHERQIKAHELPTLCKALHISLDQLYPNPPEQLAQLKVNGRMFIIDMSRATVEAI